MRQRCTNPEMRSLWMSKTLSQERGCGLAFGSAVTMKLVLLGQPGPLSRITHHVSLMAPGHKRKLVSLKLAFGLRRFMEAAVEHTARVTKKKPAAISPGLKPANAAR